MLHGALTPKIGVEPQNPHLGEKHPKSPLDLMSDPFHVNPRGPTPFTLNSDFGTKRAKIMFGSMIASESVFEVFFPKHVANNPGTDTPKNPNWFYYWKEGSVCGIPQDAEYLYSGAGWGHTLPSVHSRIILEPLAPEVNSGPEPYGVVGSTYGSLTVTGVGKGIQCVAETVYHEQHHIDLYTRYKDSFVFFPDDIDKDKIIDSDEPTLDGVSSDPSNSDTFGMGGTYVGYADNEIRCRKLELTSTITLYPSKDWANPGCQSKNQFGPVP